MQVPAVRAITTMNGEQVFMFSGNSLRRHRVSRRALVASIALICAGASASFVSAAYAKAPTGKYAPFVNCPRFTSGVETCVFSQVTGGEVKISSTAVPIEKTITLQGGFIRHEEGTENETESFVGAINGAETLSKTPQKVPGGLAGLVRCNEISNPIERFFCEAIFENGLTGVNATTELARPASEIGINTNNLLNEEGTALSLPLKVHLENPLLGSECYIGSSAHPVVLNLTTGTTSPPGPNKPIKGKVGHIAVENEGDFIEITNNTLVDNSFAAPEATGCGGPASFLIDPLIDAKLGLPSAAGKNTAIQNGSIKQAVASAVINSEK
jgi:hypothetical protein